MFQLKKSKKCYFLLTGVTLEPLRASCHVLRSIARIETPRRRAVGTEDDTETDGRPKAAKQVEEFYLDARYEHQSGVCDGDGSFAGVRCVW